MIAACLTRPSAPLVKGKSGKDEAIQSSFLVGRILTSRPLLLAAIGLS